MIKDIQKSAEQKMRKSIDVLHTELSKLRTGRAHPSLIEGVMVPYYGTPTPLNQVAAINVEDARTLTVSPWEKPLIPEVEKAIMTANLGLNPTTTGDIIRIPLPPLTEERRKDLIKQVRAEAENTKVAIRNIRRDANQHVKDLLKAKELSEDQDRQAQDAIQKTTDKFIAEVDTIITAKEADLKEI